MEHLVGNAAGSFRLDVTDCALCVYREERAVLRGRFEGRAAAPRITAVPDGWRIEHTDGGDVEDVFELGDSTHWYGGQELLNQLWPLERLMLDTETLITSDNGPDGLSCVQAPLWLASSGIVILADHGQILRVALNRSQRAQPAEAADAQALSFHRRPPPDDGMGDGLLRLGGWGLTYHLLVGGNIVEAWRGCLSRLGHTVSVPPETLWRTPIWTTWARFKTEIDRERVLQFADEIIAHGYPHGVMEIDDRWQTHYGDLAFDPARFPEARAMVEALHARGFAVTCWVMPFIQADAENYSVARERGYLLRQEDGSPMPVRWWQGSGFLIDARNPQALTWFGNNLLRFQKETGVDGFKFDAGEALYAAGSNEYTRRYVELAARFQLAEVRSAWGNQRAPLLFRQWDKASTWGADNGLRSVITGALAMGLGGYPFILPDMVGGNAYNGESPDAELMVRWAQASALFPAIQFSLAPWDYGNECDRLCRAALEMREHYLDRITRAMRAAAATGEPVIRPVWWLAPEDERAQVCDDEFLLGDDLLVAPVVKPGQRARDVYLPPGTWSERGASASVSGPTVLSSVAAPLDKTLVYERR